MAARCEDPSARAVELDAATLACMLAAVHTSHQLHLLSSAVAQQYNAAAAAETHAILQPAGNAAEPSLRQLAGKDLFEGPSDLGMQASAAPATADLTAARFQTARFQTSDSNHNPVSAALTSTDASASRSQYTVQHASLPAATETQDCKAQGSLWVLMATDRKIAVSLKSTEVTLLPCLEQK